ncbi:RluA family pseudouridine synthase [Aedoeadaptatus urinae]|uniref:RluA family pseudouridine synthase n=1 Tax=Aedoeadaptatus urinae TaxID=1871017 RepID=UPI0009F94F93|nr:RluA family pseudouridine synthase [Peptoniphilus urinae]
MISNKIDTNDAGMRLDRYLKKLLPNAKASLLYKSIRKKNITVNGKRAKQEDVLVLGDTVEIYFSDETLAKFSKAPRSAKGKFPAIVFESADFIIMDKPVGILSHGTGKAYERNMVDDMLAYLIHTKSYNPRGEKTFVPSICNRLDRNTSGLILGAKTAAGLRAANEWIRDREVEKYYMTIVEGVLEGERKVENRLKKEGDKNRVVEGDEGKEALGIYRPLKSAGNYTLVEAELITGRTHQIRQQLASIGHPVVGDRKYGSPSHAFRDLHHQLLHAYKLVFPESDEFPDVSGQVFISEPKGKFQRIRESLHF